MSENELEPLYLITGSDRPKVEYALRRLRSRFDPGATDIVSAIDNDAETVVGLCNSGTLFGGARLVVVQEVDGRRDSSNQLRKGWKAADVQLIAAYATAPSPDTTLCLVGEDVKPSTALAKLCAKTGQVLDFAAKKQNLGGWVAERFRQLGVSADAEGCGALLHIVGDDDLHALSREIEKLATWADGQPIGALEVEQLATPGREASFELTDAWGRRDQAAVLAAAEVMFDRSGDQPRSAAARISGTLVGHAARLRQMKRAAATGQSAKDVAGSLRMHPYYAGKVYAQAEGFSDSELDDAAGVLAGLDHALKGGSRLSPELEVERHLAALVREPGR